MRMFYGMSFPMNDAGCGCLSCLVWVVFLAILFGAAGVVARLFQ